MQRPAERTYSYPAASETPYLCLVTEVRTSSPKGGFSPSGWYYRQQNRDIDSPVRR